MSTPMIRQKNLQRLIDDFPSSPGNRAAFCRHYGLDPLQIGQYFTNSENGRNIGERKARSIENVVGLPEGWLDIDQSGLPPQLLTENQSDDESPMPGIAHIRFTNASALAKKVGGLSAFARTVGLDDARVSHIIGKNPTRNIGHAMAQKIESAFQKPNGWLDGVHLFEFDVSELKTKHAVEESKNESYAPQSQMQLMWATNEEAALLTQFRLATTESQKMLLNFAEKMIKDPEKLKKLIKLAV